MPTWLFPMPWHMYMPGSPPGSFFANVSKHWSVPRLRTYKSIQVRVKRELKKTWWLKKKCQAKAKEAKASLANYKIKKNRFLRLWKQNIDKQTSIQTKKCLAGKLVLTTELTT